MKLSTNHAHEKTAWLETVQFPGQSPKVRQSSEKSSVTSPSPWVERHPASLSERTYSKSSPPRSESIGSPPNSATPKGSLSTSGVHSQVHCKCEIYQDLHSVFVDFSFLVMFVGVTKHMSM